jgi:serine/threonine protein kinase
VIPVNHKLGQFEVIRKLARGGMADIYLGRNQESGQQVALKVIERSPDMDELDSIEAERQGSALQAQLAAVDPRVVRIYGIDDTEDYFLVAMEYIEGEDLAALIRRGPLPVSRAVEIAIEVCETLKNAHDLQASADGKAYHGIVHGDVKPRNIRIDLEGRVRLIDFGIAKALSLSRRLTRNEFGSVPYAAPERLDTGQVDALCDVWSAGVVLYEMVTGLQPYHAETTERLEKMIRSRIPPSPAPNPCPEPLRRILAKAIAPERSHRYQSAGEFAADLRAFRNGIDIPGLRNGSQLNGSTEATRRTARSAPEPDQATRRTAAAATAVMAKQSPAVSKPKRRVGVGRTILRATGLMFLGAVLYVGYEVTSTYLLWNRGEQFASAIKSETIKDPEQVWQQWTELSRGNASSFFLRGARHAVKQNLVTAADTVILTYRNIEMQTVLQKDWERARSLLTRALGTDPGDDSIRGKLRLAEAHIARINGTARRSTALLNQSAEKFREAQQLIPNSPDPQLGLARLYVYGFRDIDRADSALREAERRGYQLGNRERAQLADGYRDRADRLWNDSRAIRGLPQEKEQVHKVIEDYKRALHLYQEVAPFGNATANISRVQSALDVVEQRAHELEGWFRRLWP